MKVSKAEIAANYVILLVSAAFALFPILTIVITALTGAHGGLRLANFADAWTQGAFGANLLNSLEVTLIVVVLATAFSVLAGYAFGTMQFRGSTILFYLFLLGIMVPAEAIVVPLFYDLRTVGLTDTVWGVAMPQVAQSIAFGTFWMRAHFRTSDRSIMEAAALDGASPLRSLTSVMGPIARPAIITLVVLEFMWTWNEFLIPLVMSPAGTIKTAPLALSMFKSQHVQATNLLAAASILVALPVVIVYLFMQRHFIRGMVEGAVKD